MYSNLLPASGTLVNHIQIKGNVKCFREHGQTRPLGCVDLFCKMSPDILDMVSRVCGEREGGSPAMLVFPVSLLIIYGKKNIFMMLIIGVI